MPTGRRRLTRGSIHITWVWRESPDVASNHDMCYARSDDGGSTWVKSTGEHYALPIIAATAEVAAIIPPNHELMNQTSMCTDATGRPIIATYFSSEGSGNVQYQLIYREGSSWVTAPVSRRRGTFTLSGGGSKKVPISRPQVIAATRDGKTNVWVIFRDEERESRVSVAHCAGLASPHWDVRDLADLHVRSWEPSYDRVRWQRDGVLDLYVQTVGQGDGEKLEPIDPQMVYVLEWKP